MDIQGKKIMITCGGGVGDLIMYTPALRALKQQTGCHITFVTPQNKEIIDGLPFIDEVVEIRRKVFGGRFRKLHKVIGMEAVIFTDWQPYLMLAAKMAGVPVRAGFVRKGKAVSRFINRPLTQVWHASNRYVAETHAMVFAEALGIRLVGEMTRPEVASLQAKDCRHVDQLLQAIGLNPGAEFVLLSPYTGFELRNWPEIEAKKFVQAYEKKYGYPVVVIGTKEKELAATDLARYSLMGKTTLLELVELIKRAKLLITPDSGPMHIAGAVGTPVVSLFSKDLPSRWAPKRKSQPIYLQMPCSPCTDEQARQCTNGVRCMRDITAELVLDAIEQLDIAQNK